jgi:hypothetical protein
MFIKPTSVFLHGKVRFEPGKVHGVSTKLGFYFIAHGWAEACDGPAHVTPAEDELGPEPAPSKPGAALEPDDGTVS